MSQTAFPEAPITSIRPQDPSAGLNVPLPSSANLPVFANQASLTPLVCDQRAIAGLLEKMLSKAGLSTREVAKRMGVASDNAIRQYLTGRRRKPSMLWFIRFAELTGARIIIEFPSSKV